MFLLFNAHISTQHPSLPRASALLIQGERILAIGDEALRLAEERGAKRFDLGGRTVWPGLCDAHLHLKHYALALRKVDCETATLQECLERVAERARHTPAGEWILGHGWNQNPWGGWPEAAALDAVAPHHPVYLTAKSLHAAWVNRQALQLAGITTTTPDPPNGRILRRPDGEASGILLEDALRLVERVIPEPRGEALLSLFERAQSELHQLGVTSVHDFDGADCFQALQVLRERGRLALRVTKSIPLSLLSEALALGLRSGFGDDFLRIGGVKIFMDGALGPRTAALFEPYLEESQNYGILNLDGEELAEIGRRAVKGGLSLAIHAIGDRANHEALKGLAQVRAFERTEGLPPLRHRLEHVQLLHPQDVERLAQLGIVASMQPIHAPSDRLMAERYWGAARLPYAYAWRRQLEAGAHLIFGSDAPVESPNPFWGLYAAVTRRHPQDASSPSWYDEQAISLREALRAYTTAPAWVAGMGDRLGKLMPGFLADLLVLEQDPFDLSPQEWKDLRPIAVMVGGEWIIAPRGE
ncbi:MAG: amidohydrolase [Anaerolineales bacterium]